MRVLADENVDAAMVERLRRDGHDVAYVAELDRGISDDEVLARARDQSRVLLTEDTDFGEMAVHCGQASSGVVLARLGGRSGARKGDEISEVFAHYGKLPGHPPIFATVDPGGRVRVRQL